MTDDTTGTEEFPDIRNMSSGDLLEWMGTDSVRWTAAFVDALNRAHPGAFDTEMLDPDPGGQVHVWLAGAIEAGIIEGRAREARSGDVRRGLAAAGVLHRDELSRLQKAAQIAEELHQFAVDACISDAEAARLVAGSRR